MQSRLTSPRTFRRTVAVVATVATVAGLTVFGASSAQADSRVLYAGAVPSWAKASNLVGAASASTIYQGEIFLTMKDRPGAVAKATAVSTPGDPSFRQYVAPADWIAAYAPTQDNLTAQLAALTAARVTNIQYPASRLYVTFRGTAKQFGSLFSTQLSTYSVDGTKVVAPSSAPSLPASLAAGVTGISIDQGRLLTRPKSVTQAGVAQSVAPSAARDLLQPRRVMVQTPCSTYNMQRTVAIPTAYGSRKAGTANCGYTPAQLRSAYKISSRAADGSLTGSGQTVAVVGTYNAPSMGIDLASYARLLGEPAANYDSSLSVPASLFKDQAACGQPSGWQTEQALDVEAVHAVAPGAKILYSGAGDCGAGLDLALSKVLDQGLANIVSNSYGGYGEPNVSNGANAAAVNGEINLQLQAAAEGIGLYFASGDDGDERANIGTVSPDFPASSPWVTAVGGTAFGLSSSNQKIYEVGWGDQLDQIVPGAHNTTRFANPLPGYLFGGGAGGGKSALFARPAYQSAAVVPASQGAGRRLVPDVAALADPYTGFLIGLRPITSDARLTYGNYVREVSGGTSLATPIYAAMMAVVQQKTGARIGFANPVLYGLAKTSPSTFVDVVTRVAPASVAYSSSSATYLVTLGQDSSLKTAKGYDTVTGLGGLNLANVTGFATPPPRG